MKRRVIIKIFGKVHGVSFRVTAKHEADRLGVTGYVVNCDDGSVCVEAEGMSEALDQFTQWCQSGPDHARVERVDMRNGAVVGYEGFEIRRL